jgi:hypothetical protein
VNISGKFGWFLFSGLSSVSQNVLKFYHQLTSEERRIPFIFSSPGHRPCELLSWVSVRPSDHPVNISGKFGWFLFSGFREEDLNVKS